MDCVDIDRRMIKGGMQAMEKTDKDARFEEAKFRMVMKLKKVSRKEAEKPISTTTPHVSMPWGRMMAT